MRKLFGGLLVLAASCADPVAPPVLHSSGLPMETAAAVIGTWNLTAWNGKPVPAKYSTYLGTDDVADSADYIGAGSIVLSDAATYSRVTDWQIRDRADGSPATTTTRTESGSFTGSVAAGTVTLNLFGPVTMTIAISGSGTIMSARFIVQDPFLGPITQGDVWTYTRAP